MGAVVGKKGCYHFKRSQTMHVIFFRLLFSVVSFSFSILMLPCNGFECECRWVPQSTVCALLVGDVYFLGIPNVCSICHFF